MTDVIRTSEGGTAPDDDPVPESTIPIIQEYKGKPTILLNPGAKWPFSLGLGKAKVVLANISFLQRFVDSNGTEVEP